MKDYYKRKTELAKFELTLIKEAIATRLHNVSISADDFALYAELLKGIEDSIKTNEEYFLKAEKESQE